MSVPGSPPTKGLPAYPPAPDPTCPSGQHFSHCGCQCRKNGGIEPLCYQQCDGFKPVMIPIYMPPMMKPCTADKNDVNTFKANNLAYTTSYSAATIVLFRMKELNPAVFDTYTPLDCSPGWDCSRNLNLMEKDHNRMALALQDRARNWLVMNRGTDLGSLFGGMGGGSTPGYPGQPIFVNGGTATAVSSGPIMGMGGSSTGTIGPSGQVSLSPPPDPQNWYRVLGCGGPNDIVWWKKGYAGSDMNIMQNYILKSPCAPPKACAVADIYVPKAPCPVYPTNGMCPKGYVSQTQCPACSVGPGPRCLAPCRISCVPVGTMCPPGAVCDGKPGPTLPPPPIFKPMVDPKVDKLARDALAFLGVPVNVNNKLPASNRTCTGQIYFAAAGPGGGIAFDGSGNSPVPPQAAATGVGGSKSVTLQTAGTADVSHTQGSPLDGIFAYFQANPLIAAGAIVGVAALSWVMLRR